MRGWLNVEACMLKRVRHRIRLASPFPLADKARQPAQRVRIESQRLARFTGCRFAAIGNDIRGHGGAKLAVSLIHVLDGVLAFFLRWQIKVDVRPLVPAL